MSNNFDMTDSTTLNFVTSQLSHIETQVYKRKYPNIQYRELTPVTTEGHPWAASITFRNTDDVGKAQWINGNSDDIPTVNKTMGQQTQDVHMAGIGYEYGLEEVNQAKMLGVNLTSDYVVAARRVSEEFCDKLALYGDASKNITGLTNDPDVTIVPALAGNNTDNIPWLTKDADEVLADVNNQLAGISIDSLEVEMADTILLPLDAFVALSHKRIPGTSMTLYRYIMENNVLKLMYGRDITIRGVRGLETAGVGGTSRMVTYRRDPEVLKFHYPHPHKFLKVQHRNLQFVVPGFFRVAGLSIRVPGAIRYLDGI